MKCRILVSGKNKENISKCCLLKCLPNMINNNDELLLHSNSEGQDQHVQSHLDLLWTVPFHS